MKKILCKIFGHSWVEDYYYYQYQTGKDKSRQVRLWCGRCKYIFDYGIIGSWIGIKVKMTNKPWHTYP